jgi:hypothetical protein
MMVNFCWHPKPQEFKMYFSVYFLFSELGLKKNKKFRKRNKDESFHFPIWGLYLCFVSSLLLSFSPALLKNQNGLGVG